MGSGEGDTAFYADRGKGGKRGRRELPRPAYEALCATLGDAGLSVATMDPAASLWQAAAGPRGMTSSTFYARFRRYLRAAGLPPTGLHILRHTAAKLRRDAGASIEAASSFLDHSSFADGEALRRKTAGAPPRGFEPLISTLKGWRPGPLDDGGRQGGRV